MRCHTSHPDQKRNQQIMTDWASVVVRCWQYSTLTECHKHNSHNSIPPHRLSWNGKLRVTENHWKSHIVTWWSWPFPTGPQIIQALPQLDQVAPAPGLLDLGQTSCSFPVGPGFPCLSPSKSYPSSLLKIYWRKSVSCLVCKREAKGQRYPNKSQNHRAFVPACTNRYLYL